VTESISIAVQELAADATRLAGRTITEKQVQRLLEAGLLPTPQLKGLGQSLGRKAVYPPETAALVVEASGLIRRHHSMDIAALTLFMRGRPVKERAVRRAYAAMVRRLAKVLSESPLPPGLDVAHRDLDPVDGRVTKLSGSRSRRVESLARRMGGASAVHDGLLDLSFIALGVKGVLDHLAPEAFLLSNLPPQTDVAPARDLLQRLHFDGIVCAVADASWPRVCLARDAAAFTLRKGIAESFVLEWAPTLAANDDAVAAFRAITRSEEYPTALLGIPAFLIAVPEARMKGFLEKLGGEVVRLEAVVQLMRSLPEKWRRFADNAVWAEATKDERERFEARLKRWIHAHPAEAEMLAG
jgi:hypothetical protein